MPSEASKCTPCDRPLLPTQSFQHKLINPIPTSDVSLLNNVALSLGDISAVDDANQNEHCVENDDQHENASNVPHTCSECRSSLNKVYHHCLSQNPIVLSSHRQLLENLEIIACAATPDFNSATVSTTIGTIITEARDPLFKPLSDQLIKDAQINMKGNHLAASIHHSRVPIPNRGGEKFDTNLRGNQNSDTHQVATSGESSGFEKHCNNSGPSKLLHSASLLKYTLNERKRETTRLRAELCEKEISQVKGQALVEQLRLALRQSLIYCEKAATWQDQESSTLKKLVEDSQVEIGSLMAHMVLGEEEKQRMRSDTAKLIHRHCRKDAQLEAREKEVDALKSRLHGSLKDFLHMNEMVERMTEQAEQGTELAQRRNEILQENLSKLTEEATVTTHQLQVSEGRVKVLELELTELVQQCNTLSDACQKSDMAKTKMQSTLQVLTHSHTQLFTTHAALVESNLRTEKELQTLAQYHATIKRNMESKIEELNRDFLDATTQHKEGEAIVKRLQADSDQFRLFLATAAAEKQRLSGELAQTLKQSQSTLQIHQSSFQDLQKTHERTCAKIHELESSKDRLLFRQNELQNENDRLQLTVSAQTLQGEQSRKIFEEGMELRDEQIERLQATTNTLTDEKRILAESIHETRQKLKQKEESSALEEENSARVISSKDLDIQRVKNESKDLSEQLKILHAQHLVVCAKLEETLLELHTLTQTHNDLEHQLSETHSQLLATQELSNRLTMQRNVMEQQRGDATAEKIRIQQERDVLISKIHDLDTKITNIKAEYLSTNHTKDLAIKISDSSLLDIKNELAKQSRARRYLMSKLEMMMLEMKETSQKFVKEVERGNMLESKLEKHRHQLASETKMRMELESMNSRLNRNSTERQMETLAHITERERKLQHVDRCLKNELQRLTDINRLVATDSLLL